jgi:predicted dehydrogenase
MMVFDDMDAAEPIRVYDKGVPADLSYDTFGEYLNLRSGDIHIPWVKSAEPLRLECAHFIDCVRDRSRPLSDGWNGAEVVKILEAAQMSMESGGDMIEL